MTTSPNDTGVDQFVGLLAAFQPIDVLRHRQCREAVFGFIERSENTFREELLSRIKRPRKRRRRDSGATGSQANAEAFFTNKERNRSDAGHERRQASPNVQHLLQAVRDLESGMETSPESYSGLYNGSEGTTPAETRTNRQQCAIARLDNIENASHTAEGRRRLRLLRIVYEIDRLQHSAQRVRTTPHGNVESDVAAAERAFSDLSGIDVNRVNTLRTSARPYINIAGQKNGLGILLMLGCQSRHLWQRISKLAFSWLWQFCEENLPHVLAKAQTLQSTACQLVRSEFAESGAAPNELREDGHIFSRHFLHLESGLFRPGQSSNVDALVTAAEMFYGASELTRQKDNGRAVAGTNHVTSGREGGESQSTVPPMVQAMEDWPSWGTSNNADEDWASMMLAFPNYETWFQVTDMRSMPSM